MALPIAFGLAATLIFLRGWLWWRKRERSKTNIRHPLREPLLRPAGYSVGQKAEDAMFEAMTATFSAVFAPLVVFGCLGIQTIFAGKPPSDLSVVMACVATAAMLYYFIRQALAHLLTRRNYRLGWEGELKIAQDLQPLWAKGFRVFHDLPCNGFNIDHVVVGPSGVYAIETKTWVKRGVGDKSHQVIFDGQRLQFPDYTTDEPVRQATAQAQWLSEFLSKSTGMRLNVSPVLCVPGWWVERQRSGDVVVLSGKDCWKYFVGEGRQSILDEARIDAIAYQLEQKCRDVDLRQMLL